jgi:GTP-binding protein
LISRVSSAKPKIASYPFTTLTPHLGVVYNDYDSLVIADIPGIIEGAHRGEGMGLDFLRHIERNRVLIFLIDISGMASVPPLKTFEILRNELKSHKSSLARKRFFVVGNKCDLLEPQDRIEADHLKSACLDNKIDYLEISALKGLNLAVFKQKLFSYYYEQ